MSGRLTMEGIMEPPVQAKQFVAEDFFPAQMFEKITEIRVDCPNVVEVEARRRHRRRRLALDNQRVPGSESWWDVPIADV